MRIKRKSVKQQADQQIALNQMLVSQIKDTMNYLEPELDNEAILVKLVMVLTPIADTGLLNSLKDLLNTLGESKLHEVKEMYAHFFDETETPNNN